MSRPSQISHMLIKGAKKSPDSAESSSIAVVTYYGNGRKTGLLYGKYCAFFELISRPQYLVHIPISTEHLLRLNTVPPCAKRQLHALSQRDP